MEAQIVKYTYDGQFVEFDISSSRLMVNATEMAKIFGKLPADFLRLDQTKAFVQECLSYGISHNSDTPETVISPFLGIEKEDDLFRVNHRHGTWMHRILALKFAAWLDPKFELWIYLTIDKIIQARGPINSDRVETRKQVNARIQKNQAKIRKAQLTIEEVAGQALEAMEKAKLEIARDNRLLAKLNREDADQLNMFVNTQEIEETEAEEA